MTPEQLKQAGFSKEEVQTHNTGKRDQLFEAGFTVSEVNENLGATPVHDDMDTYNDLVSQYFKAEFGVDPSEADYRAEDPESEHKIVRKIGQVGSDVSKSASAGFQQSVTGLLIRQEVPEMELPEDMGLLNRISMQASMLAGDFPWMVGGAVIGTAAGAPTGPGAAITGMGGAFALPSGLRKVLMDKYGRGDVLGFRDFWHRLTGAVGETIKGEIVGMATGAAAKFVPQPFTFPAEVGTMVTVGAALEGHVPEPEEFLDAAIIIGGLKGATALAGKFRSAYTETGKRPAEILRKAEENPAIKEDLLSEKSELSERTIRDIGVEKEPGEAKPAEVVPERIVAPATKHPKTGKVYEGVHHGESMEKAGIPFDDPMIRSPIGKADRVNGFVTNRGRFVDRKEALTIARKAKQTESAAEAPGAKELAQDDLDAFRKYGKAEKPVPAAKPAEVVPPVPKPKEPWEMTRDELELKYPKAGEVVDGRKVRSDIPNQDSIGASIDNATTLDGIYEIPLSEFDLTGKHYSVQGTKRIAELAEEIKQSGEINPLIVVIDAEQSPYILEGATRAEALYKSGAKSFPAKVVLDEGAFYDATKQALSEGKPVPAEVLKDYPDLKPPVEKPYQKPRKRGVPGAGARTLRGRIRTMGKINPINFTGEVKELPLDARYLFKKDGIGIDVAEEILRSEGWLDKNETLFEVLRYKENLKRDNLKRDMEEKKAHELAPEEKRIKKEMEWEPEAPPEGEYVQMKAEDLPKGKEITIIEGDTVDGWDVYRVVGKDPFGITLQDGTKIELAPTDLVDVLKTDVAPFVKSTAFEPSKGFKRREPTTVKPTAEPVKRSEIQKFLSDNLDVPIRTGRFKSKGGKILGIFKPKEEVIRTGKAKDIEVISHEIGHGLQKYLWPESWDPKKGLNAKFLPFKDELKPIATVPRAGQDVIPEGFAEFVRLYITDVTQAKKVAPKFYDFFEKTLTDKAPEAREIFIHARDMYQKWLDQPAMMRVLSEISVGEKETRPINFTEIYTAAIDDLNPLGNAVKKMAAGEQIEVAKDPYKLARLMKGWHGKAEHFIEHSPYKFKTYKNIGKPLKDILKPIKDLDEFRAYIVSKRALELHGRNIETGIFPADAKEMVKQFGPKYEKAFKELKEYQEHTLNYLKDAGILDANTIAKMREANKDYIPFYRVMEGKRDPGGTGKGFEARQPIKKIKGSWRDIVDPLESVIKNTYAYINLAEKNRIGMALVELAEGKEGMGKYVEKIPKPMQKVLVKNEEVKRFLEQYEVEIGEEGLSIFRPSAFMPKDNVISVWRNGKQELYQVNPEIARTFQALDAESVSMLLRILSKPASWLRAGAVLSPEFMARNPIRDQFSAFVYSKYGFIPGWDLAKGMGSLIAGKAGSKRFGNAYREWLKGGGAYSMLVSMDRAYLQKKVGDLRGIPLRNVIKNPIEGLRILSELSEAGTRIGEFKKARKKGASIEEAGFAAREVTLDFARMGAKTKAVNALIAFWNANVQGSDKLVRAFKERPVATTAKTFAAITLPSILLEIANHDDERVQDLPQWQKDLFWIIPTENTIWRIPKPFELGIIFGTVPERITRYILDQDPEAFDGVLESLGRGASPGILPTISIPLIENWANKSIFLDRSIVPASREALLPEYQYTPYTTEAAKGISRIVGALPSMKESPYISPAKIENLIRGWSGGLGTHALRLADYGLKKAGVLPDEIKPTKTLSDIPVIKAFVVRYPSAGTESIQKFYDQYSRAQRIAKTAKVLIDKEFKPEQGLALIEEYQDSLMQMASIKKGLSTAHRAIELIYNNPDIGPDEKRQLIDVIYLQMTEIAKEGNKAYKAFQKQIKEQ